MADTPTRKNLFVDANVFLSFYHFSNDDLQELRKLVELIKKEEIVFYATKQVIDETSRNRDTKIQDAYKKFTDTNLKVSFPQMCKGYPEYEDMRKALAAAEDEMSKLKKKLSSDIASHSLKADEVIKELLALATVIDTEDVVDAAHKRYLSGNPPGKNNSYGDAITWEALLSAVPKSEDLFFISDDKDYKSPLGGEQFNSFLSDEWTDAKKSKIFYYPRLSAFFAEHHKDIALRIEEERRKLIQRLADSGSFATTHAVISKLEQMGDFLDDEVRQLVDNGNSNDQVYSIMTDPDVKAFFGKIHKERGAVLTNEAREQLAAHLSVDEELDLDL